jgi:predicted nucleic acid-binding protein
MDEFRSFVRKFPEDYDECWTGVAGQLGFDNEKIRLRKIELINKPMTVRGEFVWEDKSRWIVRFVERADGRWIVAKLLPSNEANQIGTMEAYSAFEDDEIVVNRPANAKKYMMGLDVQQFSNKSESVHLEAKNTKKSDTSIAVLQRRDTNIDISDNPKKWITKHFVASFRARLATNKEATEEALKAAIYYGSLIHIETNRTDVWEKIVEWKFSGYLNFMVEILADGQHKIAPKPGTHLTTPTKKKGFSLLADYFAYHSHLEPIYEFLEEADMISSMEQLTAFDRLAAHLQALLGDDSIYSDLMFNLQEDDDKVEYLGARTYYY